MIVFRLDSIGLACFSHDFGTLDGKPASVAKAFDAFGAQSNTSAFTAAVFLLGQVFSIFTYLPTSRDELYREMKAIMIDICNALLERTKKEKEQGALDGKEEKSIIGLLSTYSHHFSCSTCQLAQSKLRLLIRSFV